MPTSAENLRLVARYQAGDQAAGEALLRLNAPLLRTVCNWYAARMGSLELGDLLIEASLGLLEGARRYDPHRGAAPSTILTLFARQFVARRCEACARTIRIPVQAVHAKVEAVPLEDADRVADPAGDVENAAVNGVFLEALLELLPQRQREVIIRRFFNEESQGEIGQSWGLSRQAICGIEARAMARLREAVR